MGMINLMFFWGMILSAYYPLEIENSGINYTFYQHSVQMSFGPKSLLGDYGIETEQGRRVVMPSFRLAGKSLAKIPFLAILSDAIVDVTVVYEANWMGIVSPHDLVHQYLFVVNARYHDGIGSNISQEAAVLSSIESINQNSKTIPKDDLILYVARGESEKVVSLTNIKVNQSTEDFFANVYFVDEGTSAVIKKIILDIRHGETRNFIPPEKVEIGFNPNENLLRCRDTGPLMTGCLMPPRELLPASEEQTDYSIRYQYSCIGEDLSVFLKTDLMEKELKPSEIPQEIVITGDHGPLWLDMKDPASAYASYVLPNCTLNILNAEGGISLALENEKFKHENIMSRLLQSQTNLFVMVIHLNNIIQLDEENRIFLNNFIEETVKEYTRDENLLSIECSRVMSIDANASKHPSCVALGKRSNDIKNMLTISRFIDKKSKTVGVVELTYEIEEAIKEVQTTLSAYCETKLMDVIDEYESFLNENKLVSERSNQIIKEALDVLSRLGGI